MNFGTAGMSGRWALGLLVLNLAAAGCGGGFKTVPVAGKIFVDGQPLTAADAEATVVFRPDEAKGNTIGLDFSGFVDNDGNYQLYYGTGNRGAALGWYRVAVVANEPRTPPAGPPDKSKKVIPGPKSHLPKSLIDRKYTLPATSGIEIEVVQNPAPGAYDLNLTGLGKK